MDQERDKTVEDEVAGHEAVEHEVETDILEDEIVPAEGINPLSTRTL